MSYKFSAHDGSGAVFLSRTLKDDQPFTNNESEALEVDDPEEAEAIARRLGSVNIIDAEHCIVWSSDRTGWRTRRSAAYSDDPEEV
jgi:hypothetical protein